MNNEHKKNGVFTKLKLWILSLSLSSIIASVLVVGVTLAFLFSITASKENLFFPGYVDCEVVEDFDGTTKASIKIQNTGNTDAYIRVHMVSYYQNTSGSVIAQTSSVPEFDLGDNWTYASDGYYYYKLPVAPGDQTGEMLASHIVLSQKKDNDGNVVSNQVVEVFAEAVQAYPEDAVVYAWDAVAAVTGTDDHLVLKVKHYDNYLSAANYGARYRGFSANSDKETDNWKVYHTGILNNDVVSADDVVTLTSDSSNQIKLSFYMINIIELKDFAIYITDNTNVVNIMVYASDIEVLNPTDDLRLGAMTKSSVTGNYISDVPSEMAMEYALNVDTTKHKQFATVVITTDGPSQAVTISEIRVMGYMSHNNIAPAAQYKGDIGTQSVVIPENATGSDFTSWNEYHKGRLNDTTRSSAVYDEKPKEKVMVQCTDDTADSLRIIYKLDKPALIDLVEMYMGALNLYGDPDDNKDPVVYGNNEVIAFNVYVSETENQEDWKLLGTDTSGLSQGDVFLKIYAAGDTEQFGQYVIIEVKGTPGQMYYGFNEAQIWSNATLDLDEIA